MLLVNLTNSKVTITNNILLKLNKFIEWEFSIPTGHTFNGQTCKDIHGH